jgi:hypothetical protein
MDKVAFVESFYGAVLKFVLHFLGVRSNEVHIIY